MYCIEVLSQTSQLHQATQPVAQWHRTGLTAWRRPCTGPTGKILLMPEDPNSVFIMVATGTGIAPYRAFWRRQFMEDVPGYKCAPPPSRHQSVFYSSPYCFITLVSNKLGQR